MAPDIANDNGALKVRFGVTVVESLLLKSELKEGRELVLKCAVELFKVRDYWLDGSVSSAMFQAEIRYDRLKEEFVMTLPNRDTPLRDTDFDTLLEKGWGSIETTLGPWNMLQSGNDYSLRLITTINEKDAPEGFYRFLYFWSWDAGVDNTFHLHFTF